MGHRILGCAAACILGLVAGASSADDAPMGRLEHVGNRSADDLDSVVNSVISPDGKFLYSSSWKLGLVSTSGRDAGAGSLQPKQTTRDRENLLGVTGRALIPDGLADALVAIVPDAEVLQVLLEPIDPEIRGLMKRALREARNRRGGNDR